MRDAARMLMWLCVGLWVHILAGCGAGEGEAPAGAGGAGGGPAVASNAPLGPPAGPPAGTGGENGGQAAPLAPGGAMGGGAAPSVEGAPDALPAQASAPDGGADAQRADPPADAGPAVNAWGLQTGNRLYRIDSVTSPDPACARAVMTQVGKSRTVEAGGNLLRVHGTGTSDGTAALLDFGQAKLADDGTGVATKKNTLQTMPGIVPGAYCTWSEQLVTAFRATASPPAVTLDVKVTEEKFAGCGAGDVARMMALSGCELSFVLRPL